MHALTGKIEKKRKEKKRKEKKAFYSFGHDPKGWKPSHDPKG